MKQSHLFTKTTKNISQDEVSNNAQLLMRAGFIHKEMAGVYTFLPLGYKVLQNIIEIIREEMNAIGGQEILMNGLQRKELWEATDRWSDEASDVWFKTQLKNGSEVGLGWTHEEQITDIMKQYIHSHKDLPKCSYQFQTKFRNETRAKSGIMRTREFIMKDLYSFCKNKEEQDRVYEEVKQAYHRIFERCGIGHLTYFTFASGGAFSKFSHEFQTITEAGEDIIYIDEEKGIAINEEVMIDEVLKDLEVQRDSLIQKKASEVGNIFNLGTRFSKPLDLTYTDETGALQDVVMGSYGIGPARVMGVVAEVLSDEQGLVWPETIAPFKAHLILLGNEDFVRTQAEEVYQALHKAGVSVLYDDRNESPGVKLKDADLMGMPVRVVVGAKSLEKGGYEVKKRNESNVHIMSQEELIQYLKK